MKRIVCTTLVVLAVAALAAAQTGTTSGSGFQLSTPTSQRKAPPAAKTAEEGAAYQAIVNNPDVTAAEAAAKDFEAKNGQSELRGPIYQNLMYRYQQANNADKTIEMGRKALQFDPDQPMALVTVASVLSERTKETDLDRDQRLAEAMQDAQRALTGMDAWLATAPPPVTDQLAQSMKPVLSSFAHAAMGMVEMTRKNPGEAEKHYRMAVELNTIRPEAITWLRLALALDAQKKYVEALPAANRAVELSAATPGMVAEWAKQEQARLAKLTGQPAPASAPATPPQTTSPPQAAAAAPTQQAAPLSYAPCKKSNYWCEPLRKVISDRDNDFVGLRGKVKKRDSSGKPLVFSATVTLPGAYECEIQGGQPPTTYNCLFRDESRTGAKQLYRNYAIYVREAIPTEWQPQDIVIRDQLLAGPTSSSPALLLSHLDLFYPTPHVIELIVVGRCNMTDCLLGLGLVSKKEPAKRH